MKVSAYLIDTGPILAVLDSDDQYHDWALRTIDSLDAPLISCEAVLSEAWFLARRGGADPSRVLELVKLLNIKVLPAWSPRTEELLRHYANRASMADASLLSLAESDPERVVVTTGREDFSIYRIHRNRSVPALMPA